MQSFKEQCALMLTKERYASMPFDNIKTRIQGASGGYTGVLDCAVKIFREEGVWAFWRGSSPRLARLTVGSEK